MQRLLATLLVLSLAVSGRAAEEAKPNTLTAKEIADGWLLLFDGETAFGWDAAGKPTIREGALVYGGDRDVRAANTTAFFICALHFEYRIDKTAKDAAPVQMVRQEDDKIPLTVYEGWTNFTSEGGLKASAIPRPHPQLLSFEIPKENKLSLRNVKVKPLNMKPRFNGKNLSGWKKFENDAKRAKSQFSVAKEGWLSIKNGPGDLQTTGQWADFVLQLDCRTNGDNLNSGVFFRCIPGEYQNGYEAQIQNQKAKEPKKYTIQEYDAQTHELQGKKAIENWSQDYGTGAIYRRVPARRSVAKDREWFTMTVVARGRHIATWVNGIQVADWTDNRPENNNARNGCRLKKGPISLQGHDPTTDLNFRNIRLADLAAKD